MRRAVVARQRFTIETAKPGRVMFRVGEARRRVAVECLSVPLDVRVGKLTRGVVVTAVGLPQRLRALERGTARLIAEALERDPWVEQVHSVKIKHPKQIFVHLTHRTPAAAVLARPLEGVYCWVDRTGVRLPLRDAMMRWWG